LNAKSSNRTLSTSILCLIVFCLTLVCRGLREARDESVHELDRVRGSLAALRAEHDQLLDEYITSLQS
jgi:hypothetical protein